LDLEKWPLGLAAYVFRLEEAILNTLEQFGIKAERTSEAPGVWLDYNDPKRARKICALGIQASRWVTMHGFALNVNTDLNYFNHIVPCGIAEKQVTSMEKELGEPIPMEKVKKVFRAAFESTFGINWTARAASDLREI
jgi:lipoyl(octanoyl) transferase